MMLQIGFHNLQCITELLEVCKHDVVHDYDNYNLDIAFTVRSCVQSVTVITEVTYWHMILKLRIFWVFFKMVNEKILYCANIVIEITGTVIYITIMTSNLQFHVNLETICMIFLLFNTIYFE